MIDRFADDENGGFFETSTDHEQLVARRKDLEDHPIPSGNSSAAYGLLRLAALTGEHDYARARRVGAAAPARGSPPEHPQAFGHLLQALDFRLAQVKEVALVGDELGPLERVVRAGFRPHLVLAGGEPATACRCSRAAIPWTAGPPPTSASSSPAGRPSPSRTSSKPS